MQKLVKGIHHFQHHVFEDKRDLFERLAAGQRPMALMITCSDSRISPGLVTQTDPGDIFLVRNAGNLVPAWPDDGGEAATVEFAIEGLGIRDIIICGHSDCGAMKALIGASCEDKMPCMASWLRHADRTREIIASEYSGLEGPARLSAAIEENVLVQLENLRTHPAVARCLERGELRLHAWVYKFETGEIFSYEPESGQFRTSNGTDLPGPALPSRHYSTDNLLARGARP